MARHDREWILLVPIGPVRPTVSASAWSGRSDRHRSFPEKDLRVSRVAADGFGTVLAFEQGLTRNAEILVSAGSELAGIDEERRRHNKERTEAP
jgi:hypothetical protein